MSSTRSGEKNRARSAAACLRRRGEKNRHGIGTDTTRIRRYRPRRGRRDDAPPIGWGPVRTRPEPAVPAAGPRTRGRARIVRGVAQSDLERRSIDTIRGLAMDAVQKANAGHPGTAMALAPLAYLLYTSCSGTTRQNPAWPDRDRFVLSAGHACILQYARAAPDRLRPVARRPQAVPPVGLAHARATPSAATRPGVEMTTGPLGQGVAQRRRHGDRRALPRGALQPARTTRSSTTTSTRSAPTAT